MLVYAPPGSGKTWLLGHLPRDTVAIDTDNIGWGLNDKQQLAAVAAALEMTRLRSQGDRWLVLTAHPQAFLIQNVPLFVFLPTLRDREARLMEKMVRLGQLPAVEECYLTMIRMALGAGLTRSFGFEDRLLRDCAAPVIQQVQPPWGQHLSAWGPFISSFGFPQAKVASTDVLSSVGTLDDKRAHWYTDRSDESYRTLSRRMLRSITNISTAPTNHNIHTHHDINTNILPSR
jgi:hypothetical protein